MNRDGATGPRWLESLARRAARGQVAPLPIPAASPAAPGQDVSRRTVLRSAAGAALLAGPLRFLIPATAHATPTPLQSCRSAKYKTAYVNFQGCGKGPLEAFKDSEDSITFWQDALAHNGELPPRQRAAARKRLTKIIKQATRERDRAVKQIEDCNFKWLKDRDTAERDCQAANPPTVTPPGNPGPPGGCAPTPPYFACGDECCNGNIAVCCNCTTVYHGPTCILPESCARC